MHASTPLVGLTAKTVAAVRTTAAYLFISLYILLAGPPSLLFAIAVGSPRLLYAVGIAGVRLGLAMVGIRYRVAGREHIRLDGPAVYCVNHTSNVEPPVVFAVLRHVAPRLRILYKKELHSLPILGRVFDIAAFIPIDRGNREQTRLAVDQAAQALREGYSFVIFPEGTRSRTDNLLPFKRGGFVMAIQAGAPVVPIAVQGARLAMKRGSFLIYPTRVSVRIGEAIETTGMDIVGREALIGRVRARLEAMLAEGPLS